jgi:PAS domain S-box-containing protein
MKTASSTPGSPGSPGLSRCQTAALVGVRLAIALGLALLCGSLLTIFALDERFQLSGSIAGMALTLACAILFSLFAWRSVRELQCAEQLRLDTERIGHAQALQLDALIASAMDAIVMLDEHHAIIAFNPAAESMFGHARAAVLGRSLDMLMPQRFRAGHGAQVGAFGNAGSTARRMGRLGAVTALRADGAEFPVEASISMSRSGHGLCYTAIVRDVTEVRLAEAAMVSVVAGSVAKSNYITHMTHELRTPLNTILGYAQLLERSAAAPAHLAAIRHIIKAGWHLRDLIAEVQDLASIEAHSAGLSSETVLIDGVIDELCGMMKPLVADAGLSISMVGTAGLAMHANRVRLKQILLNLLSNATKYNRAGGVIHIVREVHAQGQIRIGVRDGGHGLNAIELAGLFQPFNRLGQEHGHQVGTGVGLVVTKKLVESMGGAIGAESEVGHGSLFWFQLPCAVRS